MMKPLFFMGYTVAPDPMPASLFGLARTDHPDTRTALFYWG